jgi:hypothetical protein
VCVFVRRSGCGKKRCADDLLERRNRTLLSACAALHAETSDIRRKPHVQQCGGEFNTREARLSEPIRVKKQAISSFLWMRPLKVRYAYEISVSLSDVTRALAELPAVCLNPARQNILANKQEGNLFTFGSAFHPSGCSAKRL